MFFFLYKNIYTHINLAKSSHSLIMHDENSKIILWLILFSAKGKTPDTCRRRLSSRDLFEDKIDNDDFVPQAPKGITIFYCMTNTWNLPNKFSNFFPKHWKTNGRTFLLSFIHIDKYLFVSIPEQTCLKYYGPRGWGWRTPKYIAILLKLIYTPFSY